MSLSSRRAWIEIKSNRNSVRLYESRSPHGERGLKYQIVLIYNLQIQSLSSRRAWIEIRWFDVISWLYNTVALLTESVDWNYTLNQIFQSQNSRSPHGERGLKFIFIGLISFRTLSLSSRRAWIEIWVWILHWWICQASLSSRRAWIEIDSLHGAKCKATRSLSSRRAWIEIYIKTPVNNGKYCRSPHGERGLKWFSRFKKIKLR